MTQRIGRSLERRLELDRLRLASALGRLRIAAPFDSIGRCRQRLERVNLLLAARMRERIARTRGRVAVLAAGLDGVSPLRTLERGYAIITDTATGALVRDAQSLREQQRVSGRLARGGFEATIDKISKK